MSPPPAGINFRHNSGAFGEKYLPETLGPGCAFLDYDNDGWQDILLINGMDWPGHMNQRSTMRLYRNNRNGTFTDVTRAAGLDVEMYGMGVAVGDYNNDGFPDIFVTCRRPEPPVSEHRPRHVHRRHREGSGLGGRNALQHFGAVVRLRPRRPAGPVRLQLREMVARARTCSAAWTASTSRTARRKPIAAPPAGCSATAATAHSRMSRPRAASSTPARNRWAWPCSITTATAGRICSWPTIRSPTSSTATSATARFEDVAVHAGVAFSEDGKARAGMGVDVADYDNSGIAEPGRDKFRQRDDRPVPRHARRTIRRSGGRARTWAGCRGAAWASAASSSTPTWTACSTCWW